MRYQLVVKGDGAAALANLRKHSPMHGLAWRQVGEAVALDAGESKLVLEFDSAEAVRSGFSDEYRSHVEFLLNTVFVAGPQEAPFPDGAMLHWARLQD